MELELFPEPQEEERQVRDITRAFVDAQLRPWAVEDDEMARFRREAFNELAALGLNCLTIPQKYGGKGLSYRANYACLEELARGAASMAVTIGVTNLIQGGILQFGTEGQKEQFLVPLVKGEWLGAFALSEPQSGSDAAGLQCAARKTEKGYVLNGTKMWCSNAGVADLYLVMARTGEHKTKGVSAFLVHRSTPGFSVGKQEKKLGLRASPLAELIFEDCFVPETQRLAPEGHGMKVALSQLDAGRITIGAAGIALATEALERAWSFFARRAREGIPFEDAVRQRLAQSYAELQSVRALLGIAAGQKDAGARITLLAAQVKLLGSDLAMNVTSEAVELMGGAGMVRENEVERLMRDAKALQIVEGTNQIQRLVIAREMDRMFDAQ